MEAARAQEEARQARLREEAMRQEVEESWQVAECIARTFEKSGDRSALRTLARPKYGDSSPLQITAAVTRQSESAHDTHNNAQGATEGKEAAPTSQSLIPVRETGKRDLSPVHRRLSSASSASQRNRGQVPRHATLPDSGALGIATAPSSPEAVRQAENSQRLSQPHQRRFNSPLHSHSMASAHDCFSSSLRSPNRNERSAGPSPPRSAQRNVTSRRSPQPIRSAAHSLSGVHPQLKNKELHFLV